MKRSLSAGVATVLLVATVLVAAAGATAPGRNGRITFRRYFDAQQTWGAVFTIAPDGSSTRQVTRPPKGYVDDQPDWAPDGSLIAFTRCTEGQLCHVFVVRPDGTGFSPVGALCPADAHETTCPDDSGPSFTPDSQHLTFTQSTGDLRPAPAGGQEIQHSAIAVTSLDGAGRSVIVQAPPYAADLVQPMVSPDGTRVVFEWINSPFSQPANARAVFVVDIDGTGLRRLTPWAENDGDNPDWSPDGRWILFRSQVDTGRQSQIYVIRPDGTGRRALTRFPAGTHVASSSFSPDGAWITFAKGPEGGNVDVFTMRLDGRRLRRLTRSKLWDSAPDWGPS